MSAPGEQSNPVQVPAPPGGHPLRIDRSEHARTATPLATTGSDLPIVEEFSAGGIVVKVIDGRPHAAVIARRNRARRLEWCLPKGHLEGAETPIDAAIREIAEETGILGAVRHPLGVIDYWFTGDDRRVHKIVYHFLLDAIGGELTVENDPDAEAEDVEWIAFEDLSVRLSYPNERRIAGLARSAWEPPPTDDQPAPGDER